MTIEKIIKVYLWRGKKNIMKSNLKIIEGRIFSILFVVFLVACGNNDNSIGTNDSISNDNSSVTNDPISLESLIFKISSLSGTCSAIDVAWSGSDYLVVGGYSNNAGFVASSDDSTTWSVSGSGSDFVNAVIWGNGAFFTAGLDSGGAMGYITKYGDKNARNVVYIADSPMTSIVWNGSVYVATGGSTLAVSSDGNNWQEKNVTGASWLDNVVWGDNQFIAIGQDDSGKTVAATSADGNVWTTAQQISIVTYVNDLIWDGSRYVGVGIDWDTSTSYIHTSADGYNWTSQDFSDADYLGGIVWTGNKYVAVGSSKSSAVVATSTDLIKWDIKTVDGVSVLRKVIWTDSQFVAVGHTDVSVSDGNCIGKVVTWRSEWPY